MLRVRNCATRSAWDARPLARYAAYRASGRAAQALRVAQLRTRGIAGPSVWASFVVRSGSLQ